MFLVLLAFQQEYGQVFPDLTLHCFAASSLPLLLAGLTTTSSYEIV
jgi:hypothetical protein